MNFDADVIEHHDLAPLDPGTVTEWEAARRISFVIDKAGRTLGITPPPGLPFRERCRLVVEAAIHNPAIDPDAYSLAFLLSGLADDQSSTRERADA